MGVQAKLAHILVQPIQKSSEEITEFPTPNPPPKALETLPIPFHENALALTHIPDSF